MKIKRFSKIGRFGSGLKKAIKYGAKGALYGGVLAPGNGLALATGHKKIAAGLTGVGALVGAGVGSKWGWEDGVSAYDHEEKMKNDPEYRKKIEKEEKEAIIGTIEGFKGEDLVLSKSFKYSSWVKVKEAPKEFLDYVKFYENTWSKKIKLWYAIDPNKLESYHDIPEFKEFFPIPYDSKTSEEWLKEDPDPGLPCLCLATFNSAGDDGWLVYDPKYKKYGVDLPDTNLSLKEILLRNIKSKEKYYSLSSQQKRIVNEFETKIKSL